jgi:uncharacterized membrane protein
MSVPAGEPPHERARPAQDPGEAPAQDGAAERRARRMRRRRARRERWFRLARSLRPESRRNMLALLVAAIPAVVATLVLRAAFSEASTGAAVTLPGLFIVLTMTIHTAAFALLTHWSFHRLDRRDVAIAAREARARRASWWVRWVSGRGSIASETLGTVLLAVLAIMLLLVSAPGAFRLTLLVVTIVAIVASWYSTAVTLAVEYAAEDCHGDAFELPFTRRGFDEYLYISTIVQVSGSANESVPVTRGARRLVRLQSLLGHVLTTVVVALGISVVITVL